MTSIFCDYLPAESVIIIVTGHCYADDAQILANVICKNEKSQKGIILDVQNAFFDSSAIGVLIGTQLRPRSFKFCLIEVSTSLAERLKRLQVYNFFTIFKSKDEAIGWIQS